MEMCLFQVAILLADMSECSVTVLLGNVGVLTRWVLNYHVHASEEISSTVMYLVGYDFAP